MLSDGMALSVERHPKKALGRFANALLIICGPVLITVGGVYLLSSLRARALSSRRGAEWREGMIDRVAAGVSPSSKRTVAQLVSTALIISGSLLLAVGAAYYGFSRFAQSQLNSLSRQQQVLDQPLVTALKPPDVSGGLGEYRGFAVSSSSAPLFGGGGERLTSPSPTPAPAAARITIPSLEVDAPAVETGTKYEDGQLVWETAKHAVGHLKGTSNPGETGNIVMAGHISSPIRGEGNVFKRLPEIALGSQVYLYTPQGRYTYIVVKTKVVLPNDIEVIEPTLQPTLTLITCVPDWVYTHRFIATALPAGFEPM